MDKYLKKKIFFIVMLFIVCVFVFPLKYSFLGCVYANKVDPGTKFIIPSATEHPQYGGNIEADIRSLKWTDDPERLYKVWLSKGGQATADEGLCYITVDNTQWILIATAGTYGEVGDYLQVTINNNGVNTNYSMMIFDTKRDQDDIEAAGTTDEEKPYYVNGVHYGHNTGGKLDILEFPWDGQIVSRPSGDFLNTMKDVTEIINGGNYFKNPEGPTGLTGPFKIFNGAEGNSNQNNIIDFTDFWGAIKSIFGGLWDAICIEFENVSLDRDDITTQYDLNDKDDSTGNAGGTQNSGVSASANEIVEKATKWMEDIANDNSHGYKIDDDNRYGQNGDYSCSGLNIKGWMYAGANIHEIGGEGVYGSTGLEMYKKAGFQEIFTNDQGNLKSELQIKDKLQRGDVLLYDGHTAQYVGNNKKVEACGDYDGVLGDSTTSGGEITINPISGNWYPVRVLRYYGNS